MKKRYLLLTSLIGIAALLSACGTTSSSATPSATPSSGTPVVSSVQSSEQASNTPSTNPAPSSEAPAASSEAPAASSEAPAASSEAPAASSEEPVVSSEEIVSSEGEAEVSSEAGSGDEEDPNFAYKDYLVSHNRGEKAKYYFEAEMTNLGGKQGPGYSGAAAERAMTGEVDNHGYVSYLYAYGMSVNFLVVAENEVTDATLSMTVGAEFLNLELSPENYSIRVDNTTAEDLTSSDDGGALGNWDEFFLNYYTVAQTGGYYITSWDCEKIAIDATGSSEAGQWGEYKITAKLHLFKGVTSISLITANSDNPGMGTMQAYAPVVDNISIETTAQLGMFDVTDNGYGSKLSEACHF